MGIKVTLGGEPIALKPGGSLAWTLAYGMRPSVFDLETTTDSARKIQSLAATTFSKGRARADGGYVGPLKLVMEDPDNGRKVEIAGIYVVVGERPGTDYNTKVLTLADQRWLWPRTVIVRSYNIRRKTGDFRLIQNELSRIQVNRQRADFGYRAATLNGVGDSAKPWTAMEVLEDILKELCGKDGYKIDAAKKFGVVDSIEGLELHDQGPDALSRVLSYIPGARVYIGTDGKAHVASIYDGSEIPIFKSFAPGNSGDWSVVDKSQQRSAQFNVYSDREVELRFDYEEARDEVANEETKSQVRGRQLNSRAPGNEPRWLENVIINPLYRLQLEAGENPRYASLGEPIPIDDFITAFNLTTFNRTALPNFEPLFPRFANISKDKLRKFWFGPKWGLLRMHTCCMISRDLYNQERVKLLQALRAGYRTTYRVLPQWRDKIRTLMATRAAVLDWETGTRAPASVFTQYIQEWTQLGYSPRTKGIGSTAEDDWAEDIGLKNNSPFEVTVLDSDMALFKLTPRVDQTGMVATMHLGAPLDGKLPSVDKANTALYWNLVILDPAFKLSVIMTATQDVPNNEGRMEQTEVTLKEAATLLKLPEVPIAKGPVQEILQTAETARFAWKDSDAAAIEKAFFEGASYPDVATNPEAIKALAVSAAAQVLVTQLDKAEGHVSGPLTPIEPTGNLRTVTHSVNIGQDLTAAMFTTLHAPGDLPPQNLYAQLPEGIRRKVRRLVQP